MKQYKDAQDDDSTCMTVKRWCLEGWPAKSATDVDLSAFWKVRSFFSFHNNLLLYNQHIVIPSSLRRRPWQRFTRGIRGSNAVEPE